MKKRYGILILAVFLAGACALIPVHALEVSESGGAGRVVFLKRVAPGDKFTLSFIHSVEKSEVTDYFRIDGDCRIILYQTEFSSLNTGLPAVVSDGEIFERTHRGFSLSGLNRIMPDIELQVSAAYGGTLTMKNQAIILPSLTGDGPVRISIRKVFAWELMARALGL